MTLLKDVAMACGVSKSTASAALRGVGEVSSVTRERIRAMAEKLGYIPDPAAARLSARRTRPRSVAEGLPIVIVGNGLERSREPHRVAIRHAARLGYACRVVEMPSTKEAWILQLRRWYRQGIAGIIFDRPRTAMTLLPEREEWRHFALAGRGTVACHVPCHSVRVDPINAVFTCCQALRAKGYTRIGLAILRHEPEIEHDRLRAAAGLLMQAELPEQTGSVPLFREPLDGEDTRSRFLAWVERYRPDAVVGFSGLLCWWLREAGWRVPEQVAFATLHRFLEESHHSGYDVLLDEMAQKSVELLDELIRRNETGWPVRPRCVVLTSGWAEGQTTPGKRAV